MEKSNKIRIGLIVGLAILSIVFLIQNAAVVEVQLLFWPVSIPRSLLIIVSMGLGVLGTFIFFMMKKHKESKTQLPPKGE